MSGRPSIKVRLLPPMLPNFVRDEADHPYDVASLDDVVLRAVGREWTKALLAHAAKRRQQREKAK